MKESTRDLFETFTNIQELTGKLVSALEERIKSWEPNSRLAQIYLTQQVFPSPIYFLLSPKAVFAYYSDYVRYYYTILPTLKTNKELVNPILVTQESYVFFTMTETLDDYFRSYFTFTTSCRTSFSFRSVKENV